MTVLLKSARFPVTCAIVALSAIGFAGGWAATRLAPIQKFLTEKIEARS